MSAHPRPLIAAIPYAEGAYPDALLAEFAADLRARGHVLAGVIQHDLTRRDRTRCDMALEDLTSGAIIGLSEDRGPAARGCRIDPNGLAEAEGLIARALAETSPDLLIINKFGKIESEGGGLRMVIAHAVLAAIPVLIGVPQRNLDAWEAFAGPLSERVPADRARIEQWLTGHLRALPGGRVSPGPDLPLSWAARQQGQQ
jgi:nucleoside-triphosphatase THEP1